MQYSLGVPTDTYSCTLSRLSWWRMQAICKIQGTYTQGVMNDNNLMLATGVHLLRISERPARAPLPCTVDSNIVTYELAGG